MTGIVLALILMGIGMAAGVRLLNLLSLSMSAEEKYIFGFGTGLLLFASMVLILGVSAHLTAQWIMAGITVIAFMGIRQWGFVTKTSLEMIRNARVSEAFLIGCVILSFFSMTAVLIGVLAPETANDSLCYHLHIPKIFLQNHVISKIPYEINSLFPFFMEMLDTIGLALNQISLAKMFHMATGLAAAYSIFIISKKAASAQASMLAALLFLTTPGIVNHMGTTYVDVPLACFTLLSFYAYFRFYESGRLGWIAISGLMIGVGLSIKFLALVGFIATLILIIWDGIAHRKSPLKAIAMYGMAAFVVCAYWYIRSWIEWGNPVYPYFVQIFKSGYVKDYGDIGVTKNLFNLLAIPWTMTMKPQIFEGFGDNIGPSYLMFFPLMFAGGVKNPLLRRAGFFSLIYLILWFFLGQSLRFFFPALPVVAVLMAAGLSQTEACQNHYLKTAFRFLVFAVFGFHAALAIYHYYPMTKAALHSDFSEAYLRQTERSYRMAEYVNDNLPMSAKILNSVEVRMLYFKRPIVREDVYADVTKYYEASSEKEVIDRLKASGFSHFLLITGPETDWSQINSLRAPRIFLEGQKSLASSHPPLYTYTFNDGENPPVTYSLYQL